MNHCGISATDGWELVKGTVVTLKLTLQPFENRSDGDNIPRDMNRGGVSTSVL